MNHGLSALLLALSYLWIHFAIVLFVATLATSVDALVARSLQTGGAQRLSARAISNLGCATLGFVIAFFAGQGISQSGSNMTLTAIATGLTTLITAGLAVFENRDNPTASVIRTGAASFLVTAVISYEVLNLQLTHIW